MKLRRILRTLITALGSAALGQIVSRWIPPPFASEPHGQEGSTGFASIFPFLVGGLIAGVAMGFAARDEDLSFGIVAFLLIVALMVYPGVLIFGGASSRGLLFLIAASGFSLVGLWIGRRIRGDEAVA